MNEPAQLVDARKHLSLAESRFRTDDGLAHLQEGLALLEEVMLDGAAGQRAIAANLLTTYANRICESARKLVESDPALPEPDLERLFKMVLAFDAASLTLPEYLRSLKIEIARRLVEFYYEGHSAEEKQKVLQQLTDMGTLT